MKTAIISGSLPPVQSGQSLVLYQLLKDLDPLQYCLITEKNTLLKYYQSESTEKLQGRYYYLSPDYEIIRTLLFNPLSVKVSPVLDAFLKFRAYQIRKILKREQCESAVVCTGDLFAPPATYLACKSLKIPFIYYVFDDYIYQWTNLFLQAYARKNETHFITNAAATIVPNECLLNEYQKRYGINPVIIRNPVDIEHYNAMSKKYSKEFPAAKRIVYTGAIYDAHYGAFRNLVAALKLMDQPDLHVHIYTNQFPEKIKNHGISGPVTIHKNLPNSCMPALQQSASILYLPFGFEKNVRQIVMTSAPGKIGEYLLSGRPVLVHAPPGSFVSWFFKKHNCGVVIDQDEPTLLAKTIKSLLYDTDLQQKLKEAAYFTAKREFDVLEIQKRFSHLINMN